MLEAIVPGSVYGDLLRNGRIADPFYRKNEYEALEYSRRDYEYCRQFTLGENDLRHERLWLRCEGLDTLCDIYVNNKLAGTAENMHRTYELDVKSLLRSGGPRSL